MLGGPDPPPSIANVLRLAPPPWNCKGPISQQTERETGNVQRARWICTCPLKYNFTPPNAMAKLTRRARGALGRDRAGGDNAQKTNQTIARSRSSDVACGLSVFCIVLSLSHTHTHTLIHHTHTPHTHTHTHTQHITHTRHTQVKHTPLQHNWSLE